MRHDFIAKTFESHWLRIITLRSNSAKADFNYYMLCTPVIKEHGIFF